MAAEVVAGAFLTVSLEVLSGRIRSIMEFVRRNKVDAGLLNKLEIMLLSVKGVLNDAEKKQVSDSNVRQWLQKLNDAIHDAEDLVDEINTEALRCEIEGGQSQSSRTGTWLFQQVRNFISSRLNVKDVEQRINDILNTLKYIVDQKQHLGLSEGVEPITSSCATTLVKESDIYGRDDDKQAILDFLLSDDGHRLSVLPIVGMAGIGKTILAQLVYNEIGNKVMQKPFDIIAWITVSVESNVSTLTEAIYKEVTKSSESTIKETFKLQQKLGDFLKGKKFLLVLDDVWNVDYKRWCELRSPFESTAHGSKIIVTTRSADVASDLGTVPSRDLQILSEEDGWQLVKKRAFNDVEQDVSPDLEVIGRQIVRKCKGLPLAIKSLSCLLHSKQEIKYWENVLNNDIWDLPKCEDILPALWLSYYYLPSHLKRCFAYCSIFPKDYKIEKKVLILLWMAQDLLQPHKTKIPEEVGEEYINDLVSRSFFQYWSMNKNVIIMHDLMNDLALFVSGCCFRLEDKYSDVSIRNARHVSSFKFRTDDEKKIKDLCEHKLLRTLLKLKMYNVEHLQSMQFLRVLSVNLITPIQMKLLNSICNLKLLRYLDLSYSGLEEIPDKIGTLYNLQTLLLRSCHRLTSLPDSIGNLKHLRYLDLTCSSIEKLPDTICQLHELHTLILFGCRELTQLSINNATDVINLRCLDISATGVREMPRQMSKLENLQMLPKFVVGKDSGSNIKELGKLNDLHGYLSIEGLENVVSVEDAREANLIDKVHITGLTLAWSGEIGGSVEAREVLDGLRPHLDPEELHIHNYGGTTFSHWVGSPSFSCMTRVRLIDCKNCFMLPPLGQLPSLEFLEITGLDKVVRIGDEFYSDGSVITKPFKSLKFLYFSKMEEWKEWASVEAEDGGVFTNLKELHLEDCPKLKEASCLPDYLPSLETLDIAGHHLVASLSNCRYPSLSLLTIERCRKMKTFPGGTLPSTIQKIIIRECPELVSLSEEGWPSNLKSLQIRDCRHMMQWNLGMLTSLTSLYIGSIFEEEMDAFPKEEGQLPTTLTSLSLDGLQKLKSLNGSALAHLTSLQYLFIGKCGQIQCLPQQGLPTTLTSLHLFSLPKVKSLNRDTFRHLTSLQKLTVVYCEQLQCLPQERLPESLLELEICQCPLLKPRCERGIGEDWPYICHITRIVLDWNYI
ncbi:putative disease resistance RPP13-like protein 1 isoform X1 [Ziziphus jujuba]|uniref:Disease resistance RPP13-like protein 1 isoform X1 n=1 Tax=Ziziphus jujuba TaxID=326968 RepID=A0ABM4A0D1_ZIZJJ|nr:putative disease resistance RPP13-like protein 1 isoform X1 [Ziziphus jujuba]XP_048330238.2 putative disease resistance RPP13-like protein 1 isoform X1 [Ziziphus jujuba]XP_048330246.2 putative disease resistance RPP13-like protein 1 isoform X1 [Ziziphus jujuba]XP_048330262.2 putative disease resistance RPP13-like protein 1 isoform X1 [Ziziphus jujuba]XP_048330263.2 putative disease resistance RPP13-like protein 1 isoform X1 [Ziziphus jujuba]XP_048330268.2 putative disease resistance RPP13-l